MGVSFGGPKLQNLMTGYVDRVPVLPQSVSTGAEVAAYYEQKHKFTQVSLFTNPKLSAKIDQVAKNCQQKQQLWYLANLLNAKLQRTYEASTLTA